MIIQRQKEFEDILDALAGEQKVFVAGCSECATACKVGGAEEVAAMSQQLQAAGKIVTGTVVFDTACQQGAIRQAGRQNESAIAEADSVLVLACGTGTQTVGETLKKRSHSGAESLFVGEIVRLGKYTEKCSTCGKCVLDEFEGVCPVTRCAKGLLNGPCGGYKDGKCEVNPDQDCAWVEIYKRMEARGTVEKMRAYKPPKDQSSRHAPRSYVWPKKSNQDKQ